jgi:uncharacterized glyoxalase superfamily protein PhnB
MKAAKPIPDGFHTITPHIVVKGGEKAMAFYKKAFDAKERDGGCIFKMPNGMIGHAELIIGDSPIMLADEAPDWGAFSPLTKGGSSVCIHLYVTDADKIFAQAIAAGATAVMPMGDAPWGDRYGKLKDPFGHEWSIATHKEDMSPEEINKRLQAMMSGGECKK